MTDEEKKNVNIDLKGMTTIIMPMVQKYTAMLEDIRKELEWQRKALIQIHEMLEKK